MSGIRCIFRAALALVVFLRKPSKATIYSHRTGENMRTASRSSNSRCPTLQGHDIHPRFATIPSPVIRYLINDFGKIVGYLTLSPQAHALVANLLSLIQTVIPRCTAQGRTSIKSGTRPLCLSTKATEDDHLISTAHSQRD